MVIVALATMAAVRVAWSWAVLASEMAHRYGGDIKVEETSSQGTTFALAFSRV